MINLNLSWKSNNNPDLVALDSLYPNAQRPEAQGNNPSPVSPFPQGGSDQWLSREAVSGLLASSSPPTAPLSHCMPPLASHWPWTKFWKAASPAKAGAEGGKSGNEWVGSRGNVQRPKTKGHC